MSTETPVKPPRRRRTVILTILFLIALAIAAFLAYAATRPDTFRIERSIVIDTPPEAIYPLIDDFHNWTVWSPYEKLDADLKRTYSGAERGVGAAYAWEGKKAGAGSMQIVEASEPSRVSIDLKFTKPMQASNIAEFTLRPQGGSTTVTWAMTGTNPFIGKVMGIVFNIDKMVGKDFETGLANLKAAAEQ